MNIDFENSIQIANSNDIADTIIDEIEGSYELNVLLVCYDNVYQYMLDLTDFWKENSTYKNIKDITYSDRGYVDLYAIINENGEFKLLLEVWDNNDILLSEFVTLSYEDYNEFKNIIIKKIEAYEHKSIEELFAEFKDY